MPSDVFMPTEYIKAYFSLILQALSFFGRFGRWRSEAAEAMTPRLPAALYAFRNSYSVLL